jgi:hypothetical protein
MPHLGGSGCLTIRSNCDVGTWQESPPPGTIAELGPNEQGSIAIKLPLPPGFMTTLYKNDARYKSAYLDEFPGCADLVLRCHGVWVLVSMSVWYVQPPVFTRCPP